MYVFPLQIQDIEPRYCSFMTTLCYCYLISHASNFCGYSSHCVPIVRRANCFALLPSSKAKRDVVLTDECT